MASTAPALSPLNPARSSPLNPASTCTAAASKPARMSAFPTSRPLRPFPSIAHAFQPQPKLADKKSSSPAGENKANGNPGRKPTKIIEPPKGQCTFFILGLSQAELARQD